MLIGSVRGLSRPTRTTSLSFHRGSAESSLLLVPRGAKAMSISPETSGRATAIRFALAGAVALGVFSALLAAVCKDPLKAYLDTILYVFGNAYGFSELVVRMIPLLLTAVAAALPARIGLINVGAEGQLYMGAWLATAGALALADQRPSSCCRSSPCLASSAAASGR
jgi:ABC-type uncharacterized transport system permease subunit